MSTSVREITDWINEIAPYETAESYDNCGLIEGNFDAPVEKAGFALDATNEAAAKAKAQNVNLLITHHPAIFQPVKHLYSDHPVYRLIQADIALIAAHTNLDKARGGVADNLASYYGLSEITTPPELEDCGKLGDLPEELPLTEYAKQVRDALHADAVRYYDSGRPAKRICYVPGSGGEFLTAAKNCGADTFITGDIKHNIYIDAQNMGINLIEAGHYDAEVTILTELERRFRQRFPQIETVILEEKRIRAL